MGYISLPTRTSADVNSAADINALSDNTEYNKVGSENEFLKNIIPNGGFDVWQGATSETLSGTQEKDFNVGSIGQDLTSASTSTASISRSTDVPLDKMKYSIQYTISHVAALSNLYFFTWRMASVYASSLASEKVCLSFWIKTDTDMDVSHLRLRFVANGKSETSTISYTSPTGAWEYKEILFDIGASSIAKSDIETGGSLLIRIQAIMPSPNNTSKSNYIAGCRMAVDECLPYTPRIEEDRELVKKYYQIRRVYYDGTTPIQLNLGYMVKTPTVTCPGFTMGVSRDTTTGDVVAYSTASTASAGVHTIIADARL